MPAGEITRSASTAAPGARVGMGSGPALLAPRAASWARSVTVRCEATLLTRVPPMDMPGAAGNYGSIEKLTNAAPRSPVVPAPRTTPPSFVHDFEPARTPRAVNPQ